MKQTFDGLEFEDMNALLAFLKHNYLALQDEVNMLKCELARLRESAELPLEPTEYGGSTSR